MLAQLIIIEFGVMERAVGDVDVTSQTSTSSSSYHRSVS